MDSCLALCMDSCHIRKSVRSGQQACLQGQDITVLQKHLVEAAYETSRNTRFQDIATTADNCWYAKRCRTVFMVASLLACNTLCEALLDQQQCLDRLLVCAQPQANPCTRLNAMRHSLKQLTVRRRYTVRRYCSVVQQLPLCVVGSPRLSW